MPAKNTSQNNESAVGSFVQKISDARKRNDADTLIDLLRSVTKQPPYMYGSSIVGFGSYHYKYESGREGNAPLVAFAPRAANIVLYLKLEGFENSDLLKKLGKIKTGKGCLYIKALAGIDLKILQELVRRSFEFTKAKYPEKS